MVTVVDSSHKRISAIVALNSVGVIRHVLSPPSIELVVATLRVLGMQSFVKDKVVELLALDIGLVVGVLATDHRSDVGAALDALVPEIGEHFLGAREVVGVDGEGLVVVLHIHVDVHAVERDPELSVLVHAPLDVRPLLVAVAALVIAQAVPGLQGGATDYRSEVVDEFLGVLADEEVVVEVIEPGSEHVPFGS